MPGWRTWSLNDLGKTVLTSSSRNLGVSGVDFVVMFTDDLGSHNRGEARKVLVNAVGKRWRMGDPW